MIKRLTTIHNSPTKTPGGLKDRCVPVGKPTTEKVRFGEGEKV